jgi:hypothetical protein
MAPPISEIDVEQIGKVSTLRYLVRLSWITPEASAYPSGHDA